MSVSFQHNNYRDISVDYNVGYEVNHNTAHEAVGEDINNPIYDEIGQNITDGEGWQDIAVAHNSAYEEVI